MAMENQSLLDALVQVLQEGGSVSLTERASQSFHSEFFEKVSPQIEHLRAEQRKAYDANKSLTVA